MRKIKKTLIAILCLLIFCSTMIFASISISKSQSDGEGESLLSAENWSLLTSVISNTKKYYYKSIGVTDLLKHALSGMLSGLDPHSSYLDAKDLKDLEMETTGKFGGIGVEVVPDKGAIKVISPLDDTPAFKVGIKAGDYIVQIDDKLVRDMTLREAIGMMRGKSGTSLKLTVVRKGEHKPLTFSLRREIIKVQTIKEKILEPGFGYVRLALFQEPTAKDLVKSIKKLKRLSKGSLKGLILDMRNNPGGLLDSGVQVADYFLDSKKLKDNDLIVYTKGQVEESRIVAKATPGEILPGVPLVVLINEGSASASEIVAGALQDHKRAIVVGMRSFGKGSVQTLIPVGRDDAIKLTTALYLTPLGRLIQARGIQPDITIENLVLSKKDNDDQDLPRIDESALMDHIKNGDNKKELEKERKRLKAELEQAHKDFQLYEALHILKSQNVLAR